jgi:hypothetical protein
LGRMLRDAARQEKYTAIVDIIRQLALTGCRRSEMIGLKWTEAETESSCLRLEETITLGCLEVKGDIRQGSYSSAMGPRATSNFSMSGTYDIDSNSCIHVVGKDGEGKARNFTALISVEDVEYPTQMIFVDEKGQKGFFVWKRKE